MTEAAVKLDDDNTPNLTEVEEKATGQGWKPENDWDGDEGEWVDAKQFVFRGELMDRIKTQTKKLSKQESEITTLKSGFKQYQDHADKMAKADYESQLDKLKELKKEALKEDDYDTVVDVDEKLATIKAEQAAQKKEPVKEETQTLDPKVEAWIADHDWYRNDDLMRGAADAAAASVRAENPQWPVEDVLAEVAERVDVKFNKPSKRRASNTVTETGARRKQTSSKKGKYGKSDLNEEQLKVGRTFVNAGALKSLDEYAQQLGDIGEL